MEEAAGVPADITPVGSPRPVPEAGTRQGLLANRGPRVICQERSENLTFPPQIPHMPCRGHSRGEVAISAPSPPETGPSPPVPTAMAYPVNRCGLSGLDV